MVGSAFCALKSSIQLELCLEPALASLAPFLKNSSPLPSSSPLELAGVGEFSASVRPLFQCVKEITEWSSSLLNFPISSGAVRRKGRQVVADVVADVVVVILVLVVSAGMLRKERQVVLGLLPPPSPLPLILFQERWDKQEAHVGGSGKEKRQKREQVLKKVESEYEVT